MNNILGLRGSVKNLMSSREERSVIASMWKPMPKPSHLFSIEDIFWNSSSWSQKDAFRMLGLLDMALQICLWQARSPTAISQMNTLWLLCSSVYHNFLQESTTLAINLCPWWSQVAIEKKKNLLIPNPNQSISPWQQRYRDFHYRFQPQCNCQITGYTKVHANPLHAIIIFIHHMYASFLSQCVDPIACTNCLMYGI